MVNSVTRVRASSWGQLFDCAYKFEGEQLLGMRKAPGVRTALGSAIHASTAAFDTGRLEGGTPISVDDAASFLVDRLQHPEEPIDATQSDITVREAERIGLALHTKYCFDYSPLFNFKAVELETKPMDIDCGGGTIVQITGTLDRARVSMSAAGVGIDDVKTGGAAVTDGVAKTKGFKAQLGTYELLYEHTTGEIITADATIIGLKTKGKPEIAMGTVKGAKALMVGTQDSKGLIEIAADLFKIGLFPPNPSSMLCNKKFCCRWDSCIYHE